MSHDKVSQIVNQFTHTQKLETGEKVGVKILRTKDGMRIALKLLDIIAPTVGGAVDGFRHDDELHGAPTSFRDLSLVLCSQIDKLDILNLIDILLEDLTIDGNDVNVDDYFAANYGQLIEILEVSLKANFSSFFMGKGIKARFMKTIQNLMGLTSTE